MQKLVEEQSVEEPNSKKKIKVLLIDDDYEFFEILRRMAKNSGLSLEYAPDGFTAFKIAKQQSFDIIVSDINMPFMNGLALVGEFNKKNLDIPILLISSTINDEVSKEAFRVGAYNVLQKPFQVKDLEEKLNLALNVHRSQNIDELDHQEKAYIYNSLKSIYYDADKILGKIKKYNVPISVVTQEIDKKINTGKCLLDDISNLKYLNRKQGS